MMMKRHATLLTVLSFVGLAAVFVLASGMFNPARAVEASPAAEAKRYTVDPVHSSVIFGIRHLGVANYYGRFNDLTGSVNWDEADPAAGSIALEIKAESVDTNNQNRDQHLRSPDFFNVREFPTITFKSTRIEPAGSDTFHVTGDLTLHGVTKSITVDLKHIGSGTHPRSGKGLLGFESRFTIKRTDFRMNYGVEQGMLGEEVSMIIGLEFISE